MSYTPPPPGGNDQPPGGGYGGGEQPPGGYGNGGGEQPPGGGYGNGGYGSNYPPPPPGGEYGGGYGNQPSGDSKKATWALVTGILGILCCGPVGIAAIILGNQAKSEIAASNGYITGGGKAQAGFILGIIALVLLVVQIILVSTGVIDLTGDVSTG